MTNPIDNRQRYIFQHMVLQKIIREKPYEVYNRFSEKDRNDFLNYLWKSYGESLHCQMPGMVTCRKYSVISEKVELFVIQFPEPEQTAEALYIGVSYCLKNGFFKTTIESIRYFTLELDLNAGKEWFFGEWNDTKYHKNFGAVNNNKEETFVNIIKSLLQNQDIPSSFRKNVSQKVVSVEKRSIALTRQEETNEVQRLWEKWYEQIPEQLMIDARKTVDELNGLVVSLCLSIRGMDFDLNQRMDDSLFDLSISLEKAAISSLILGVEAASQTDSEIDHVPNKSDIPVDTDRLIKIVGNQAIEALSNTFTIYHEYHSSSQTNLDSFFTLFVLAKLECFNMGLEFFENLSSQDKKGKIKASSDNNIYSDLFDVALNDPDENVRREAQEGFKELFLHGKQGFEEFISVTAEDLRNPETRNEALNTLLVFGEMVLPYLRVYLKDPDPLMRQLITKVIVEVEKRKPK